MRLINRDDVFFDIGTNRGVFSVPASVLGASVHVFELLFENVIVLSESKEANKPGGIRITIGAIWDTYDFVGAGGFLGWGTVAAGSRIDVPTIILDSYVAIHKIPRVHTVKLDIGGSELRALRGFSQTIKRDLPNIVFESNSLTCGGSLYSYKSIIHELEQYGYSLFRIGERVLHPVSFLSVQEIVKADYLATTMLADDLQEVSSWPIIPLTDLAIIENIIGEERYGDAHRMHILAVFTRLPIEVQTDARVSALVESWERLRDDPLMATIIIGSL